MSEADRPESAQHARPGATGLRALLTVGGVLAGAAAFYAGMLVGSAGDDVPANTTVLGVQIGGMSSAEAVSVLETELGPMASAPIQISAYEASTSMAPAEMGMSFDPVATVDDASGRLYNPWAMVQRLFGSVPVDPVVIIDEQTMAESLTEFASVITVEPVEPVLSYSGLQPVLTPGSDGRSLDVEGSVDLIADAYLVNTASIALPEVTVPPSVNEEEAIALRDGFATTAVSGPVYVEAGSVTAEVPAQTIARSLSFEILRGELRQELNGAKIYKAVADQLAPIETPGNDATFEIVDGTPVVVPRVLSMQDRNAARPN